MAFLVLLALLGAARLIQLQWFAGPPAGVVLANEIALRQEPHPGVNIVLRLKAGETVITDGALFLENGEAVEVLREGNKQAVNTPAPASEG